MQWLATALWVGSFRPIPIKNTMNLRKTFAANWILSTLLALGVGVEFTNFISLFFTFMSAFRPSWGAFNYLPAAGLSLLFVCGIVGFGLLRKPVISWGLALLASVISFTVYAQMELKWNWSEMHQLHFTVIILSVIAPMLVAYTTHEIAPDYQTAPKRTRLSLAQQIQRKAAETQAIVAAMSQMQLPPNTQAPPAIRRNTPPTAQQPPPPNVKPIIVPTGVKLPFQFGLRKKP